MICCSGDEVCLSSRVEADLVSNYPTSKKPVNGEYEAAFQVSKQLLPLEKKAYDTSSKSDLLQAPTGAKR